MQQAKDQSVSQMTGAALLFGAPNHIGRLLIYALLGVFCGAVSPEAAATSYNESVFYAFSGPDGLSPKSSLIIGTDGNFYGTTAGNNSYPGTVFKVTPQGDLTTLHQFSGAPDGLTPNGLVSGSDGDFYGTTFSGGSNNQGTVFKITPQGAVTILHNFSNGEYPEAGLVQGSAGVFYGTTYGGGASGDGSVFMITSAGAFTTLHSFSGAADGAQPITALALGTDGNLYGSTSNDGAGSDGTIFKITPTGALTTLYSFGPSSNDANGAEPHGPLIQGSDGNFYGTTYILGANSAGTAFKITPTGTLTTLVAFGGSIGSNPASGLTALSDGTFLGTTEAGGPNLSGGTIFNMTSSGVVTVVHGFNSTGDGSQTTASPIVTSNGAIYGTTVSGGTSNGGVIYKLTAIVPPSVSFTQAAEETPSGSGGLPSVTLTLALSGASTQAISVPFSLGGTEPSGRYTVTPTSPVAIPAGSTSVTITVQMTYSTVLQCDKTITLTLGTPTSATLGAITTNTITVHNYLLGGLCL